jgi:PAS domain S-box-containing protein
MLKRFLLICIPASLLVGIFLALLYYSEAKTTRLLIETKESDILDLQLETITKDFNSVISDLFVMADSHEYSETLHNEEERYVDIAYHFLSFSREKRLYDQIRLIDPKGKEELRVNFNDGKPVILPKSELKDKSERYYIKRALALARGEVYVSPLDLNIEKGEVERPYKPMIRFATPVFDLAGKKRGIVVLNYFGARLLEHFESVASSSKGETVFLNSEGFWLFSPRKEEEWNFMFGNNRTFKEVYPVEWKKVTKADRGQFYTPEGLFLFRTVYPLSYAKERLGRDLAPERKVSQLEDQSYFWKFVSRVPPEVLNAGSNKLLQRLLLIYIGIVVIIAIVIWYMVTDRIGREWASSALRDSEDRFRTIRTTSFDGIVVANAEGRITEVNSVAEGFFGYTQMELLGKDITILIPEKYRSGHSEGFERFVTTGESIMQGKIVELQGLRKDGEEIALEMIINNFVIDGALYFIATFRADFKSEKGYVRSA